MVNTAFLASSLRLNRISVLEFGVAGGNGLIAMERMAAWLELIDAMCASPEGGA
jgi:hypothetical protein